VIPPWTQLEAALETLFIRLSNLPVTTAPSAASGIKVAGSTQGQLLLPSDVQQADIEFAVISDIGYGMPELRMHYDANVPYPGDTYEIPETDEEYDEGDPEKKLGTVICEVNENRQVVMQVSVSCAFQETNAYDYARAIALRLPLPSARDELVALGLALVDVGPVQGPIPQLDPNFRAVGKYAFELTCNYMGHAIDAPQTTIETADITATVDS
jgi:hypothetical protein